MASKITPTSHRLYSWLFLGSGILAFAALGIWIDANPTGSSPIINPSSPIPTYHLESAPGTRVSGTPVPGILNGDKNIRILRKNKTISVKIQDNQFMNERNIFVFKPADTNDLAGKIFARIVAEKMGLIAKDSFLSRVKFQDKIQIMEVNSPLDQAFLQRHNRSEGMIISSRTRPKEPVDDRKAWRIVSSPYSAEKNQEILNSWLELIRKSYDDDFYTHLLDHADVVSFAKWHIFQTLVSTHPARPGRLFLIRDPVRGRWEWIAGRLDFSPSDEFDGETDLIFDQLTERILLIPEVSGVRDALLWELVKDDSLKNHWQELLTHFGFDLNSPQIHALEKVVDHRVNAIRETLRSRSSGAQKKAPVFGHALLAVDEKTHVENNVLPNVKRALNRLPPLEKNLVYSSTTRLGTPPSFFYWPEMPDPEVTVTLGTGISDIETDLYIKRHQILRVEAGATLKLAPGVSIYSEGRVEFNGTENNPILLTRLNPDEPWGAVVLRGRTLASETSRMSHTTIQGGSDAKIKQVHFTGALSVYDADLIMNNVRLENNIAGDALNARYAHILIDKCEFSGNSGDDIDLDFSEGRVFHSTFTQSGNDAIDLSFSSVLIASNTIQGAADKGISVGEKSEPVIQNNHIQDAPIGIAVKDLSVAIIEKNTFERNETAISTYQKKNSFGTAEVLAKDNLFKDNTSNYYAG